jgi:predicted enzyme related to lactoylglutathione lyase
MAVMNSVVHFELPADDRKRMADFYAKAFGWKAVMLGDDMGSYTLVQTGETDEQGMPTKAGRINGGLYPRDNAKPAQFPSLVLAVDDIKAAMARIADAGGKVLGEPVEIPGYGLYVSFMDTEGNRNSVMQPTKEWKDVAAKG